MNLLNSLVGNMNNSSNNGSGVGTTNNATTASTNPWANMGAGNNSSTTTGTNNANNVNPMLPMGGNPLLGNWHSFSQAMNGRGGTGNTTNTNPWANGSGNVQSNQTPAERYATQLIALRNMGFTNEEANIRALQHTNGNVNLAVERLINGD